MTIYDFVVGVKLFRRNNTIIKSYVANFIYYLVLYFNTLRPFRDGWWLGSLSLVPYMPFLQMMLTFYVLLFYSKIRLLFYVVNCTQKLCTNENVYNNM